MQFNFVTLQTRKARAFFEADIHDKNKINHIKHNNHDN